MLAYASTDAVACGCLAGPGRFLPRTAVAVGRHDGDEHRRRPRGTGRSSCRGGGRYLAGPEQSAPSAGFLVPDRRGLRVLGGGSGDLVLLRVAGEPGHTVPVTRRRRVPGLPGARTGRTAGPARSSPGQARPAAGRSRRPARRGVLVRAELGHRIRSDPARRGQLRLRPCRIACLPRQRSAAADHRPGRGDPSAGLSPGRSLAAGGRLCRPVHRRQRVRLLQRRRELWRRQPHRRRLAGGFRGHRARRGTTMSRRPKWRRERRSQNPRCCCHTCLLDSVWSSLPIGYADTTSTMCR